jgi:hypothetical protein
MITKAKKTKILNLKIENKSQVHDPLKPPYSITTNIKVPLHSPLFKDLFLTLYYTAQSSRGPITNLKVELSEIGWGVPGLLPAETHIKASTYGATIEFEIGCSIELKIGSVEKDGLSIPMPFPKHRGLVIGWYNYCYGTHYAIFHQFGDDDGY